MKNLVIITMFVMSSFLGFAQESNTTGLKYQSFSITPIEIFVDDYTTGGAFSVDLSFAKERHLFTASLTYGEEVAIFGNPDSYFQLNGLYGREFKLNNWFKIETHGGLGWFFISDEDSPVKTLGVPIQVKFRFQTGPKFSLGLRLQTNINSKNPFYSAGIALQWNTINKSE